MWIVRVQVISPLYLLPCTDISDKKELLKKPDRYRHAIQVQAGAKDPVLKGLTCSKGEGDDSFGKSKPALAQVEIECGSCITVEKLKEAFYASMIPQEKYLRLGYLHRVVVHKE